MIFGDLGEAMVNIPCLRLPDGPGWYVGADRCLKRDLKSSGSNFMSKTVLRDFYWDVNLIGSNRSRDTRVWNPHILSMSCQKMLYWVNISPNPMNSDPIRATSCRDPPSKTSRIVINLFLEPKMRSPLEVSAIGVMFSVHGDSVWPMLLPRAFSVGFEQ